MDYIEFLGNFQILILNFQFRVFSVPKLFGSFIFTFWIGGGALYPSVPRNYSWQGRNHMGCCKLNLVWLQARQRLCCRLAPFIRFLIQVCLTNRANFLSFLIAFFLHLLSLIMLINYMKTIKLFLGGGWDLGGILGTAWDIPGSVIRIEHWQCSEHHMQASVLLPVLSFTP